MTEQAQDNQQAQQLEPQAVQPPLVTFNTTAPEPPQVPASYQSIIDQQQEQIAALMAQNQALNGQITQMVQNGAQFAQPVMQVQQAPQQTFQPQTQAEFAPVYAGNNMRQFAPQSLADDGDWSLEGLADQIGKKQLPSTSSAQQTCPSMSAKRLTHGAT